MAEPLLIAKNARIDCHLLPELANRHGLITGATGTGKTVTLQTLAEQFSRRGVAVFMADVKGDLTGISQPGKPSEKLKAALAERKLELPEPQACPTQLWDVFGKQGHPVRATISDMGPLLLGRMLGLNETQSGVLNLVFKIADDQGLLLLDLKDLRAMLQHVGDNAKDFTTRYGNISAASVGAIARGLLQLESQGGTEFFGEPMLNIDDFMQTDPQGHGMVNILAADQLMNSPRLYAAFLLWMLSEVFERLPEVGDLEKPKLVFFFDEAHLLFKDASKAFLGQVEQTVKLIRSKGVGVFFCTQLPTDVPNAVLSQLGSRVQHALRAFTPDDQQALAKTVRTYPKTDVYDLATDLTALGIGEAIVTVLSERGAPTPVAWTKMRSPRSLMDTIGPDHIKAVAQAGPLFLKYGPSVDRESAYEMLAAKMAPPPAVRPAAAEPMDLPPILPTGLDLPPMPAPVEKAEPGVLETMMDNPAFKSAMRSAGTVIGREITRSIFGTGRRRR